MPPETPPYAPFGGKAAESRIVQTQQELLNVWSRAGRNLETGQRLASRNPPRRLTGCTLCAASVCSGPALPPHRSCWRWDRRGSRVCSKCTVRCFRSRSQVLHCCSAVPGSAICHRATRWQARETMIRKRRPSEDYCPGATGVKLLRHVWKGQGASLRARSRIASKAIQTYLYSRRQHATPHRGKP